jgi:hypothetical protein
MLLALAFDDPFTSSAVDPALESVEFIHGRFVDLSELVMRGSGLVQDAAELRHPPLPLGGFSKGRQQETLAFAQVVRQKVGVIHHAHGCSDFYE